VSSCLCGELLSQSIYQKHTLECVIPRADLVLGWLADTMPDRDSLRDEPSHPIARPVRGILIVKSFAAAALLLCGLVTVMSAEDKKEAAVSNALNFTVKSLDGKDVDLAKTYQGKVVMVVNVASQCGATPQYAALQDLQKTYKNDGLVVLGFPCNQFGQQEPGSATEIKEFCTSKYNVTFDLFSKIDVNGEKADPFYKSLTGAETNPQFAGKIGWNFEKFLIGRDGKVVARFKTGVEPDSAEVVAAIQKALEKK
jgi:glutathione peroxidase